MILLPVALVLGGAIAWEDSRPGWDDTGITVAAVLAVTGVLGLVAPRRPWRWALAVGGWIPAVGIIRDGSFAALPALAVALAGAYGGMALRLLVTRAAAADARRD